MNCAEQGGYLQQNAYTEQLSKGLKITKNKLRIVITEILEPNRLLAVTWSKLSFY